MGGGGALREKIFLLTILIWIFYVENSFGFIPETSRMESVEKFQLKSKQKYVTTEKKKACFCMWGSDEKYIQSGETF